VTVMKRVLLLGHALPVPSSKQPRPRRYMPVAHTGRPVVDPSLDDDHHCGAVGPGGQRTRSQVAHAGTAEHVR